MQEGDHRAASNIVCKTFAGIDLSAKALGLNLFFSKGAISKSVFAGFDITIFKANLFQTTIFLIYSGNKNEPR